MKRALIVLATLSSLAACGSGQTAVVTSVASSPAGTLAPTASKSVYTGVGTFVVLKDSPADELVVQLKALGPVELPSDAMDSPSPGSVYIGAQFNIMNAGSDEYSDSPSNGARLITSSGEQLDATLVGAERTLQGALLPSNARVASGGRLLGYVVFEVPKGTTVTGVQLTSRSGFGTSGQWAVNLRVK